jgi:hypothetical protein
MNSNKLGIQPCPRSFQLTYCLVAAIAVYQLAGALVMSHGGVAPRGRVALAAGCLLLLGLVAAIPLNTGGWVAASTRESLVDGQQQQQKQQQQAQQQRARSPALPTTG